jgi:hypothetical protein
MLPQFGAKNYTLFALYKHDQQGRRKGVSKMAIETRRQFLETFMKEAKLESLEQADIAARVFISLTKAIIGEELSQKIAEISPLDLRAGWESVKTFPTDVFERDELLYELGEMPEE